MQRIVERVQGAQPHGVSHSSGGRIEALSSAFYAVPLLDIFMSIFGIFAYKEIRGGPIGIQ